MPEAYIIDAARTPVGKRGGGLSDVHPADLGAHAIKAVVDRTGVDPAAVEDVVFGGSLLTSCHPALHEEVLRLVNAPNVAE